MRKYTDVYRGEDEPKVKDVLWIHHSKYNDLQSGIIAEVYSKGKWVSLSSSGDSDSGDSGGESQYAPMIVRGVYDPNTYSFTPNEGEPSFVEAKNAFISGQVVFLSYPNLENENKSIADRVLLYIEGGDDGQSADKLVCFSSHWVEDFVPGSLSE